MPPPGLALVVPCHNEAARLDPDAFLAFLQSRHDAVFIFVDDGSTDGTGAVLDRLRRAVPDRVSVVTRPVCGGKGEAVRTGMLEAIASGAVLAGFVDADLSTPLDAFDDFLAVAARQPDVEIVLGSRVMLMGRDIRRRAVRHYAGRVFATAVSLTLDLPVYDSQCGAKLFRMSPAVASVFANPFASRWVFDVELLARYLRLGDEPGRPARRQRIYELALRQWHDVPGSKLRAFDVVRAAIDLARIWLATRRSFVPPAALAVLVGALTIGD